MRKALLLLLMCCAMSVSAQIKRYAIVTVLDKMTMKSINHTALIDLGSRKTGFFGNPVGNDGKELVFETEAAVLNMMAECGWEYVDFEEVKMLASVTAIIGQTARDIGVKRYLFSKIVNDEAEVKKGLILFLNPKKK